MAILNEPVWHVLYDRKDGCINKLRVMQVNVEKINVGMYSNLFEFIFRA